jgi:hypothetical protein
MMNDYGRRYMIEQMNRRDSRMRDRRDMRNSDYMDEADYEDSRDYYDEMDERRGVKGSGRGRYRKDKGDSRDYGDYEDYRDSRRGRGMTLTKADLNHWKHNMENTDGTRGEHYDMQQVMHAAEKLGVRFKEYDEKEFCVAVNMIYSDYGHIIKRLVTDKDKELMVCADFAKAYFDDPDGPEPSEKLAIHYHCMTNLG